MWASYQGNVAGGRSPPRLNRSIGVGLGLILASPTLREPNGDLEPRGYASRARLPVAMRALDGEGPFAAPAYTHPAQTQEIEFGPSSRHVSNGHRLARTQSQLRSDSQPDGTGSHA